MNGADNYHLLKSMQPELAEEPAMLKARLDQLSRQLIRALDLGERDRRLVEIALETLASRLVNIEAALFPGLDADLEQLRSILGPDHASGFNPLDIRGARGAR